MRKIVLALSLLMTVSSYALTVNEMLARFNKVKEKSKQRHGAVMERYVNVHSELAPSRSGSYETTDFRRTLTLTVHADGTVAGRGAEDGRTFELRGGHVDASHFTATKRFADGTTEPLEGIFINQRRIEGRTPREITSDHTTFGPRRHECRLHVRRRDLRQAVLRAKVIGAEILEARWSDA